MKKSIEERIQDILDSIRPFLINEGGNIEFIKFEDGIVYIKMMGACAECGLLDFTLKDTIEFSLKEEIEEVKGVVNVVE